ncbi:phage tail protein [Oceanobacillus alkalisoli]|uniref:phage tail protein n=1 Tax=Oceanobacillus alkalisoli TaxID=2925113 RepID=UPI001F11EC17|nr:phage tail protein [Oceanobacillus alkalisoli]MCF3941564.1 phage tail protein [Oceanobacillus alkalisoli]
MIVIIWKSSDVLLDGVNTKEFNVKPKSRIEIPTPEQDTEHVEIRGRNGSLTKKYGYKDTILPVEFYIFQGGSFKDVFREAKLKMINSKTFLLTDDKNIYYKVKSVSIDNAINPQDNLGEFTVIFRLDPFQYKVADSTRTITSRTTLNNPGYESQPIITATVAGTGKIYINDQVITIQNINGTIIIDSELMNAYRNSSGIITNLNNHMIGDFPILEHGNNVINFDGDISRLIIDPRWRWV